MFVVIRIPIWDLLFLPPQTFVEVDSWSGPIPPTGGTARLIEHVGDVAFVLDFLLAIDPKQSLLEPVSIIPSSGFIVVADITFGEVEEDLSRVE